MEVAEAFRQNDPEKFATLREQAQDRRYDSQQELLDESDKATRSANLANARTQAIAKYPLAKAELISGVTPDEIEQSAKALHTFAEDARKQGEDAARGQ